MASYCAVVPIPVLLFIFKPPFLFHAILPRYIADIAIWAALQRFISIVSSSQSMIHVIVVFVNWFYGPKGRANGKAVVGTCLTGSKCAKGGIVRLQLLCRRVQ